MTFEPSPLAALRRQLAKANEVILQYERLIAQLRAQLAARDAGELALPNKTDFPPLLISRGAKDPMSFPAQILAGPAGDNLRQDLSGMISSLTSLLSLENGPLNAEQAASVATGRLQALQVCSFLNILATPARSTPTASNSAEARARQNGADLVRLVEDFLATPARPQESLEPWFEASLPPESITLRPAPRTPELLIEAFLLMAKNLQLNAPNPPRLTLSRVQQNQAARLELQLPSQALQTHWPETLDDWLQHPQQRLASTTQTLSLLQLLFVAEMAAELGGGLRGEPADGGQYLKTLSVLLPTQSPSPPVNQQAASPSDTTPEPPLLLISTRGQEGRNQSLAELLQTRGQRTMQLSAEDFAQLDSWQYETPPVALLPLPPFGEPPAALIKRLTQPLGLEKHLIALSALERPNQRQQVLQAGAMGYFQQPFSLDALLQFIGHLGA